MSISNLPNPGSDQPALALDHLRGGAQLLPLNEEGGLGVCHESLDGGAEGQSPVALPALNMPAALFGNSGFETVGEDDIWILSLKGTDITIGGTIAITIERANLVARITWLAYRARGDAVDYGAAAETQHAD